MGYFRDLSDFRVLTLRRKSEVWDGTTKPTQCRTRHKIVTKKTQACIRITPLILAEFILLLLSLPKWRKSLF